MVCYLYRELQLIDQTIDWSNMAPSDLADDKFVTNKPSELKNVELLYNFVDKLLFKHLKLIEKIWKRDYKSKLINYQNV